MNVHTHAATELASESRQTRQVLVGNISWHVQQRGTGPVCLLLHGTGASCHSWDPLVACLATHYTLISVDLPGHARTITPQTTDLSLPGITRSLNALLMQEHIIPDIIVGHSAGAAIMAELCLSHAWDPQKLVSINGAILPLSGFAGWLFSPLAKLSASAGWLPRVFARRANDPRQVRRLLESTGSVIDASGLAHYQNLFRDPQHVAGVLRMMSQWNLDSLVPRLTQLTLPVQLIAATGDRTIPLRDAYRLKSLIPDATLDIVENKGHLVHEEAPECVARLIQATEQP